MKSAGDKTEPCGVPRCIFLRFDLAPLKRQEAERPRKYARSHRTRLLWRSVAATF